MRVVEYRVLTAAATAASGLTPTDGFAAIDGPLTADPSIGGFRVLRPRRTGEARTRPGFSWRRTRASTRLHASGTLSVLFIGGLALAVLAGPSSCPCDTSGADVAATAAASDAQGLSRFAYTRASDVDVFSEAPAPVELWDARIGVTAAREGAKAPLPQLAALMEATNTTDSSPISTSALPPAADAPLRDVLARPAPLATALPARIETLADAVPKPIRLAAAGTTEDELVPVLPMVEIATPDAPDSVPVESAPKPAVELHDELARAAPRPRGRHSLHTRRARIETAQYNAAPKTVRAHRWAKQMFETPWQSSAFSYIQ